MRTTNVKQEAYHLLEKLPDGATWDDLMYEIYVRQAIEAGLEDSKFGRTTDVKEVQYPPLGKFTSENPENSIFKTPNPICQNTHLKLKNIELDNIKG